MDILIGNDMNLRLLALRSSADYGWINDATVTAELLDDLDGDEVSGQTWPLTLIYQNPGSNTVGGDSTTATTITAISEYDLTVTVGATNALALSAGDLVWVRHEEDYIWKVRSDAAAAAAASVVLHLEPLSWPGGELDKPSVVQGNTGEVVELVDGCYSGVLDAAISLTDGSVYYAEVTVDAATESLEGEFNLRCRAKYRT